MPIYESPNGRLIAWYDKKTINKIRPIISVDLIEKFGKRDYLEEEMKEILFFSLEWFQNKFLNLLKTQTDSSFYLGLLLLHDFSCLFHSENPNYSPIKQMRNQDFAVYRRILKLSLEQACDFDLNSKIQGSREYLKGKENIIDELLYLGDFMFSISNLLAQQHLVEDCIDLKFTEENLFYFDYKHHYELILEEFGKEHPKHLQDAIIDDNHIIEFKQAFKKCFNTEFDNISNTFQIIHDSLESGKYGFIEWKYFAINLNHFFSVPIEIGNKIFGGLTLNRENKMSLSEEVYKPHNINKFLYRPILEWSIDGKQYSIITRESFVESMVSLTTNAFGWNKYPEEWKNDCFESYVKSIYTRNDKILENAAEIILRKKNIAFDRNIKNLKKWNNQNINIDNSDCGELDFVFILDKKIYICDSKHLVSRYDMNNYKNDYAYFETNKNNYNKTMRRKVKYLTENISLLQEHFQVINNNTSFEIPTVIEGIFLINTPTFIMYNNEFRIYTLKWFRELIENTFIDKSFTFLINEEAQQKIINIDYPYFKKPTYKVFDFDIEE